MKIYYGNSSFLSKLNFIVRIENKFFIINKTMIIVIKMSEFSLQQISIYVRAMNRILLKVTLGIH